MRIVQGYAPVRLDLAGGYTDIPELCSKREPGRVVSLAVDPGCEVTILGKPELGLLRVVGHEVEEFHDLEDLKGWNSPLLREAILTAYESGFPLFEKSLEIHFHQMCPRESGLGGSASTVVAFLAAVDGYLGWKMEPGEQRRAWAELAHRIHRKAGVLGGKQDEYAAAFGGLNFMEFGGGDVKIQDLGTTCLDDLCDHLLVILPKEKRGASQNIIDRVIEGYQGGRSEILNAIRNLKRVGLDTYNAIRDGDLEKLAEAMNEDKENAKALTVIPLRVLEFLGWADEHPFIAGTKICGAGGSILLMLREYGVRGQVVQEIQSEFGYEAWEFKPNTGGARYIVVENGRAVERRFDDARYPRRHIKLTKIT